MENCTMEPLLMDTQYKGHNKNNLHSIRRTGQLIITLINYLLETLSEWHEIEGVCVVTNGDVTIATDSILV